ncbi:hypothetical protein OBBRIDRAFT_653955 [Obba rivulosa]|uniref:Uncharacterized protein n=1 Tax=Obba rivulosa TaxID=1052685 RepID=A0A8E2B1W7_9APHY|nr:hypothetical protein OBBRIDRAFT_653955 [Obba rivulosa]
MALHTHTLRLRSSSCSLWMGSCRRTGRFSSYGSRLMDSGQSTQDPMLFESLPKATLPENTPRTMQASSSHPATKRSHLAALGLAPFRRPVLDPLLHVPDRDPHSRSSTCHTTRRPGNELASRALSCSAANILTQNTYPLCRMCGPLAGINTTPACSSSAQFHAPSPSPSISTSRNPLHRDIRMDSMNSLLDVLNESQAGAGAQSLPEISQAVPTLIVTPVAVNPVQTPMPDATFIRRPESPLARERRSPPPSLKPPMEVTTLHNEYVLTTKLPPGITSDMIVVTAQKGPRIKVVADLWHSEQNAHLEWSISNLQDVQLSRVNSGLWPDGQFSIRLGRLSRDISPACIPKVS